MLHLSEILLQHKEVTSFEELVELIKQKARTERFFRFDLKPPFSDTPENWEWVLEAAFSGPVENNGEEQPDVNTDRNNSHPSNSE